MIPLIPIILASIIAAGVADASVNMYGTNEVNKSSDAAAKYTQQFYGGSLLENSAYWDRYIRMHHIQGRQIMFPYRTGMNFNQSQLYNADTHLVSNKWKMNKSVAGAGRRFASMGFPATGIYNSLYG